MAETAERFNFKGRRRAYWRRFAKLLAAPSYFMLASGQMRSIAYARSLDRHGGPLPMFTYPAIDFLFSIEDDLAQCDVLEFGCGQSTKWFAPRVRSLLGVEKNAKFREILAAEFGTDARIRFVGNDMPFNVTGTFDIVVLDGEPRLESGRFAPQVLKDDGIIIFDNSDVQSLTEIPRHLHGLGFARIDFFGFSPTGVRKQCTSIFFRSPKFFLRHSTVMPISKNSLTERLH